MGILKIDGQFIKSLYLQRITARDLESFKLDSPPTEVRLPAGAYECRNVELQDGDSPRLVAWLYGNAFQITAGQITTLKIGGPLKPQVQATPRGSAIHISFSLVGAGGEVYAREDRRSSPQFTVTQGDRQIGSGSFEYG